ncbi:MAG TPA: serine hydrolase domain-containing protein [Vicinamibacterales bacterium]|nr:serine hydrolase domain-containing protein [Vicinamibacterales bacterium]
MALTFVHRFAGIGLLLAMMPAAAPANAQPPLAQDAATLAAIDRAMENYRLDAHVPGMVWGIVKGGTLVHVKGAGLQDLEARRPVTPDSVFRIASMTKAFTALSILKLRDDGKLSLDAPAESYVPELKGLKYPTDDSPRIRVRELLTHTAGFVTDDPWGDRQTPLPEADFTKYLTSAMPFTRPPSIAMEYSNLGYALLGRIISTTAQSPYDEFVQRTLLRPLGMTSTSHHVTSAPADRRALGYRWEDGRWQLEPTMAHGAFGAMGGIQTSANDYAKWVAFLLQAWPARDGGEAGPVRRASIRELAQGANFPSVRLRPGTSGPEACREASTYAMGFYAATDCDLGLTLSHGGGYPGYGSHVLLLPDFGVGIFAFANRTYSGPRTPVWDAAVSLLRAGHLTVAPVPASAALTSAYAAVGTMFTSGSVTAAGDVLAVNFLMDRDAQHWATDLTALKAQVGTCDTGAPIVPTGALSGDFVWRCDFGRVRGQVLLAPTPARRIQSLSLDRATP